MSLRIVAGVGSRETPPLILREMVTIGEWCRANSVWVRSGRAPGADQAFEAGAQDRCIVYLPWRGFEDSFKSSARTHIVTTAEYALLTKHAARFHPAWGRLSQGAQKLIARDSAQVMGVGLTSPVDVVICWTKDGGPTGGTGQAIRIAQASNIPVLNMYRERFGSAARVIEALEEHRASQEAL